MDERQKKEMKKNENLLFWASAMAGASAQLSHATPCYMCGSSSAPELDMPPATLSHAAPHHAKPWQH